MNEVVQMHLVAKSLRKLPHYVVDKLHAWARFVEKYGLREVRKVPGYHDEPLKGIRTGQRSIRLTREYRAIYTEHENGEIVLVNVREVHKHDY